jgi:hypothetical protein
VIGSHSKTNLENVFVPALDKISEFQDVRFKLVAGARLRIELRREGFARRVDFAA